MQDQMDWKHKIKAPSRTRSPTMPITQRLVLAALMRLLWAPLSLRRLISGAPQLPQYRAVREQFPPHSGQRTAAGLISVGLPGSVPGGAGVQAASPVGTSAGQRGQTVSAGPSGWLHTGHLRPSEPMIVIPLLSSGAPHPRSVEWLPFVPWPAPCSGGALAGPGSLSTIDLAHARSVELSGTGGSEV